MSGFQTIEVDGRIYYYDGKSFFDEFFLLVQGVELQQVTEAYFAEIDYEKLNASELLEFVKKLKGNGLHFKAKTIMDYALQKYDSNDSFLYRILPLYTSCCREMGNPQAAITIAEGYFPRLDSSVALCTSLAAAYCDLKDYEKAKKFARIAYAKQGGGQGYKTELSLVFLRIKKETGEDFFDSDK